MGKPTGFMDYDRETASRRAVEERLQDWREVYEYLSADKVETQGARCMDCGIPFCHQGCPLGNLIPDWNDLVHRGRWREALDRLHATNNFPEFTGRLCPAPCESSCVLGIHREPVTIKQVELTIIEHGFEQGWVVPEPPQTETGKRVAVIGSGPAGLAAAQQLRRVGHAVTVIERSDQIGGLLRYGIPEFKMEKHILDRRLAQMEAEGVVFQTGVRLGDNVPVDTLKNDYDAVVLCWGASQPRDLPIPGRDLDGVHFAVPFLTQANRRAVGLEVDPGESLTAEGQAVVIIGGGDTGADCLGTVLRQGCRSVVQFEIVPRPPEKRAANNPWPQWDNVFRVASAHEEGGERQYQISTTEFVGDDGGHVRQLNTVQVEMKVENGRPGFVPVTGTEKTYEADMVLLAMGFVGSERDAVLDELGLELSSRGTVPADADRATPVPGVFTAGDQARGQSLIVWAIAEGRHVAHSVDAYLMGASDLPRPLAFGNDQRPFS